MIRRFFIGIAMGICDAVPGVSGSTMALVCGIYHDLIRHIHEILAGIKRLPSFLKEDTVRMVIFFGPLAAGIGLGLISALKLLVGDHADALKDAARTGDRDIVAEAIAQQNGWLMQAETAPIVFAAFFGLIIATLSVPWQQRDSSASQTRGIGLALAGTVAAVAASLLSVSLPMHPAIVLLGGLLAISAMLLPGISGSLILLLLGLYQPISVAARNLDLTIVAPFMLGMLLGVGLMIPLLNFLLRRANNDLMAFLTGLLLGSLVAVWPWKTHYWAACIPVYGPMYPQAPNEENILQILAAMFIGWAVVFASRTFANRLQQSQDTVEKDA
jgi:putative membrane protein